MGNPSPVRVAGKAVSQPFGTIAASGFVLGERRSVRLPQFENLRIFPFDNTKVCHNPLYIQKGMCMIDVASRPPPFSGSSTASLGAMRGPSRAWGFQLGRVAHGRATPRPIRRSVSDRPLRSGQALENAQNGKGWLLAGVGMDLGSAPIGELVC